MIRERFDGPPAWRDRDLPGDAGLVRLGDAAEDELRAALDVLRANPLPVVLLDPADFELTACRETMARVRTMLEGGPGFAIMERLPVENLARGEAEALYWLLSTLLARPVAQKWDGTLIYEVTDKGRPPGNGVRPDITNAGQNFHTDNSYNLSPPEVVALLCLRVAREGGVSGLVSLQAAHNILLEEAPDLLARLYEPFHFDRQREHDPADAFTVSHPLFDDTDGRFAGRLSRFQVVNGQRLADEPLDARGAAALDALEEVMARPGLAREFVFAPGQIQFVNNRLIAHKRTAFADWPEPGRRRLLIRLWLRDAGRRFYNG